MYGMECRPVSCVHTGGSWIFGGGLDLTSHHPRCSRMARMTEGSSMLEMWGQIFTLVEMWGVEMWGHVEMWGQIFTLDI